MEALEGREMRAFDFAVDEECVEFYEDTLPEGEHRLIFILTAEEMIEFQKVLKDAMFEWKKENKKPLDYYLDPEGATSGK